MTPISNIFRPRTAPRRRMNMFYLIDTSGSMNQNTGIQQVNEAMEQIVPLLTDISMSNHDQSDIYLQCITFSTTVAQLYPEPVLARDFTWNKLRADGLTNLGGAFDMLEQQMHSDKAFGSAAGHLRPAVILMTDGDPDSGWKEKLEALQHNNWFRQAYKIAIAIGPISRYENMQKALRAFAEPLDAGGTPIVISVNQLNRLKDVVKFVSSTVSRLGTKNVDGDSRVSAQIAQTVREQYAGSGEVYVEAMLPDPDGKYY